VTPHTDHAQEVRSALRDPRKLCAALRLLEGSKAQATGLSVRCPWHAEKDPSCSVTLGPDGTIRARCFGCDTRGDALSLISAVYGLDLRSDFREILAMGAEIGGHLVLRDEILGGKAIPDRKPVPQPEPMPAVDYPDAAEVGALWGNAGPVWGDADSWEYVRERGWDPDAADATGAVRVIAPDAALPNWARYRGRTWVETGHRMLTPVYDSRGVMRSVRAWRIDADEAIDAPKRLPPGGHRASGLGMANRWAWHMLRHESCPLRLYIVEGEPDFVTACIAWPADAILGIVSGSWSKDFADAIPRGTKVTIATHADDAGERYAEQISVTLKDHSVWRIAA